MKSLFKLKNNYFIKKFDYFVHKLFSTTEIDWKIDFKIALFAFVITIFFAFPSLWLYFRPDKAGRLMYQMLQAENPLNRL